MCLTSTTVRPGLSEQLGVSILCTDHTVCVSHPLQSDLVYPNNLVSLYSVLTILYVSHIHYTQTSFIRTTWCLSTLYWPYCMCLTSTALRPRLSAQHRLRVLFSVVLVVHVGYDGYRPSLLLHLDQGCAKCGPRAKCGPPDDLVRPAR